MISTLLMGVIDEKPPSPIQQTRPIRRPLKFGVFARFIECCFIGCSEVGIIRDIPCPDPRVRSGYY
jgi:hypothetical protein